MTEPYTDPTPGATRSSSKNELIAAIRAEIAQRGGDLSFERFMELALYHPQWGYYTAPEALPTGRQGDYYTNISVGALFGEYVGRQLAQVWEILGRLKKFTVVEQGAMDAQFAVDLLRWAQGEKPEFFSAIEYLFVEPFDANRERQGLTLCRADLESRVRWVKDWSELAPDSLTGAVFSNELVDAFPVRRVAYRSGRWLESCVAWKDGEPGGFVFVEKPIVEEVLRSALTRLPTEVEEGYTTEINLHAEAWMQSVASRLRAGVVLTVDYGFPREIYYSPDRKEGTLQCYQLHRRSVDPLESVGRQDITAHVDFTTLIETGEASGLSTLGFVDQHHFILGLMVNAERVGRVYSPAEIRQLKTLLHPEMMGARFQILVQGRRLPGTASLDGLKRLGQ